MRLPWPRCGVWPPRRSGHVPATATGHVHATVMRTTPTAPAVMCAADADADACADRHCQRKRGTGDMRQ